MIAEDVEENSQASPVRLTFTTLPDILPPDLTSLSGPSTIAPTSFNIVLQQNELGSFYYAIMKSPDQMASEVMPEITQGEL